MLFYDHGHKGVQGISKLNRTWATRQNESYIKGNNVRPFRNNHRGRTKYTDTIEAQFPGRLRVLYRYAERTLGNQASFIDIEVCMNNKANIDYINMSLKMNKINLFRWFKTHGGHEKSCTPKPLLTAEMKKERVKWSKNQKALIKKYGKAFYACFLDEKWFYTTSRRRKRKVLPPGPDEDPKEVQPFQPTTVSCRNVCKVSALIKYCCISYLLFLPSPFDCYVVLFR